MSKDSSPSTKRAEARGAESGSSIGRWRRLLCFRSPPALVAALLFAFPAGAHTSSGHSRRPDLPGHATTRSASAPPTSSRG